MNIIYIGSILIKDQTGKHVNMHSRAHQSLQECEEHHERFISEMPNEFKNKDIILRSMPFTHDMNKYGKSAK